VVGRVAPRAPSRKLEKGWVSLKIGRLGARGTTRPTIYEMASKNSIADQSGSKVWSCPVKRAGGELE